MIARTPDQYCMHAKKCPNTKRYLKNGRLQVLHLAKRPKRAFRINIANRTNSPKKGFGNLENVRVSRTVDIQLCSGAKMCIPLIPLHNRLIKFNNLNRDLRPLEAVSRFCLDRTKFIILSSTIIDLKRSLTSVVNFDLYTKKKTISHLHKCSSGKILYETGKN